MIHGIAISYLVAYTATLAVALGLLLMVMIAHSSGAVWFVLWRRQAEAAIGALPALAAFGIPLVILPRAFWPSAAPPAQHPFVFAMRAVVYWIVWLVFGELLRRLSRRQDAADDPTVSRRLRTLSAAGIPLTALTMTFASFDWMMSLTPEWFSSVYGVYYFAGAMVSALALLAVLLARVALPQQWMPGTEHYQALGRLTLAFVLFWAYIWYVQFFVVWIADVPREAAWYVVRLRGGWRVLGFAVLWIGFVAPILVLLFRAARGSARVMASVGMTLLAVHYVDIYWLVVPGVRPRWSLAAAVADFAALALIGGGAAAAATWRQTGAPPVAVGDPLLAATLRYEAH